MGRRQDGAAAPGGSKRSVMPEKVYAPARGLVYRRLVDGGMVYDPHDQAVHHLNETAACVWEACQGSATAAQVVAQVCRKYQADPQQVREDVDTILSRFAAAGILAT